MNEINFEIQEVKGIELSMDVGVKEILPPIENLEVTPSKEQQVFTHENSYGYDKVTVEPIPEIKLQDKEVTPTKETQNITSNEDYDGLNRVIVKPIPDSYIEPSGTLEITENGTYNVREYEQATVEVQGSGGSSETESVGRPYIFAQSVGERSDVTSITLGTQAQFIERITNYTGVNTDNVTILIFGWVRGEYSLSDNITLLAETETFSSANQKTIVGVYDLSSSDIPTIYQTTTGRMGMAYVMLANCDTPEVFLNYTGPTNNSLITLETDNNLNIFYSSYNYNATRDLFYLNNFETFSRSARTTLAISTSAGTDKSIDVNGSSDQYGMIGVRCKYKRVL